MKARAGIVLVAVVVALAIVEAALRLLPLPVPTAVPDEMLGYLHVPGIRRTMTDPESRRKVLFETNDYGFRDSAWNPGAHPSIMVVGDSFVDAMQVQKEERFTELLAGELSRHGTSWQVLNMGLGGTGPELYVERLRKFVPIFSPEYIVIAFSNPNDLENPNYDLQPASARKNYLVRDGSVIAYSDVASDREKFEWRMKVWLGHSFLLRLAKDAWIKTGADRPIDVIPRYCNSDVFFSPKDLANSLLIVDTLLAQMHELSNHRLVILDVPERGQFNKVLPKGCDPTFIESHLASFSRDRGILFVPLYDRFAGLKETPYYVGHLNPLGHRIAAEALREAIDRHQTPPPH
jgi:hypothetical protein